MQPENSVNQIVNEIQQTILTYYDYSFRIDNERCMVVIQKLISQLENLFLQLDSKGQKKLQSILVKIVEAMDTKDYVLVRDLLYYDLRDFFAVIA